MIMNFKINIAKTAALAFMSLAAVGCSDWTEPESNVILDAALTNPNKPESYYEAIRAYKATDHAISFGWYSGWQEPSLAMTGMLSQLPDSMDMISLWDNATGLSQAKIDDLRNVQQKKGTKVLMCTFIQYIGKGFTPKEHDSNDADRKAFWGWPANDADYQTNPETEAAIKESMVKYAQAISDTIHKYGYDGLDIDFEPNVDGFRGHLDENPTFVEWFLTILKDYLGPQSDSGKMLVIDGEVYNLPAMTSPYFDYYIAQAYSVSGGTPSPNAGQSESDMERRLSQIVSRYASYMTEEEVTNRFIVTENMESAINALDGGYYWTTRDGVRQDKKVCPSLLGMAKWEPANGFRKGGFGGYRFDAEAVNTPPYKWMRAGIQAQNPAQN